MHVVYTESGNRWQLINGYTYTERRRVEGGHVPYEMVCGGDMIER